MDERTYREIEAAKAGNADALNALTERNMNLIRSVAVRFRGRGTEDADLFQLGSIGFIKAIRSFDTGRGVELSTYAVPMIMGEIRRYLRDNGMIKVSRHLRETAIRAGQILREAETETGESIPISALAGRLGVPREELAAALDAVQQPDSLSRPIGDGEGCLGDILPCRKDDFCNADTHIVIRQLLLSGDKTERKVIWLRYFRDKTQVETARLLGVSQVQVSRIEKRALKRLAAFMPKGE